MKLLLPILIFIPYLSYTQEFEWAKNLSGINVEEVKAVCYIGNNELIVAGITNSPAFFINNNLTIDRSGQITNTHTIGFLAKIDIYGNIFWVKTLRDSTGNINFGKLSFANNSIFLSTNCRWFIMIGNNKINLFSEFGIALLKLDTSGNLFDNFCFTSNKNISVNNNDISINKNGEVSMIINGGLLANDTVFYNTNFIVLQNRTPSIIFSIDSDFNYKWHLLCNRSLWYITNDDSNNVVVTAQFYNDTTFTIGNSTITNCSPVSQSAVFALINKNGNVLWYKCMGKTTNLISNSNISITPLILNNNKILLSAFIVSDTKLHNGDTIKHNNIGNRMILIIINKNGDIEKYKVAHSASGFGNFFLQSFLFENEKKGEIFVAFNSAHQWYKFEKNKFNFNGGTDIFITKIDYGLNELYSFVSGWVFQDILNGVINDEYNDIYIYGYYTNNIRFGPHYLNSLGNRDGFLVKISDISITQGELPKKEYCGGDSILMPYQKTGRFSPGNRFYLQLSNAQGMFDTLVQTIGYRADTASGIIHAKLPTEITASGQYRFRVVSDSPSVTSFYDTARYNIHPMPIAQAIRDTTICYGQEVTAGTSASNAQQYIWHPGNLVSDSTIKQPEINKNIPTGIYQFRLTARNGHCIAKDSFRAEILGLLQVQLPEKVLGCKGDSIEIRPELQGGRKATYHVTWHRTAMMEEVTDSGAVYKHRADSTIKVYVKLADGCSIPSTDSVSVYVSSYEPITISDTTVCNGINLKWQITADSIYNRYMWYDSTYTNQSDTNNTLNLYGVSNSGIYRLINKHYCKNEADTYEVKLTVLPPLKLKIRGDTTVCKQQATNITIQASGGKALQYKILLHGNRIDTTIAYSFDSINQTHQYTFIHTPHNDSLLIFTLEDGCSVQSYSDTIMLKTYKSVKIQPYTTAGICKGKQMVLKPEITEGHPPIQYVWYEEAENEREKLSEADTLFITNARTTSYLLTVTDACKTSDSTSILVAPDANPEALYMLAENEVCINQSINPKNLTSIDPEQPMIYKWEWGNKTVLGFEPKIIFDDTGTYILKLTAITDKGCSDTFSGVEPIQVYPKPEADFYANKQQTRIEEAEIAFTNTTQMQGEGKWNWDFGNGETSIQQHPKVKYIQSGKYSVMLIAINQWGCSDTIIKPEYISIEPGLKVYLPNAISANNDGLNDAFVPVGADIKSWYMEIYNRWGAKVYECSNQTPPFTGHDMQNKPLPVDTYYYTVIVTSNNQVTKTLKGSVTIIR